MTAVAGWLCLLLAAVSAQSETTVYKKVGDEVVLQPGAAPVAGPIISIRWRDGMNIAVEWDGTGTDRHRQFQERGHLNTSSGELTITGLTRGDSGLYTPEINEAPASPTRLTVISPVPTPTVTGSCDNETTSCVLTCDGNTVGAEPVTYEWRSGDKVLAESSNNHRITKEDSADITEFSCELKNPVSQESSPSFSNPFTKAPESTTPGNLKISTGLTVFICLLTALLLLVIFHRLKAGMWFFQKDSMPWETDFWSKNERQRTSAAESNGTTVRQETEKTEEAIPMT